MIFNKCDDLLQLSMFLLCIISICILILDNVEASNMIDKGVESGVAPIVEAFRLFECISHGHKEDKWNFHLVFACRHHIWRMLSQRLITLPCKILLDFCKFNRK